MKKSPKKNFFPLQNIRYGSSNVPNRSSQGAPSGKLRCPISPAEVAICLTRFPISSAGCLIRAIMCPIVSAQCPFRLAEVPDWFSKVPNQAS